MKFILTKLNIRSLLQNRSFKIYFPGNPFGKGEIIKGGFPEYELIILKVYDKIWWRKLLINWKLKKNSYLVKVKMIK